MLFYCALFWSIGSTTTLSRNPLKIFHFLQLSFFFLGTEFEEISHLVQHDRVSRRCSLIQWPQSSGTLPHSTGQPGRNSPLLYVVQVLHVVAVPLNVPFLRNWAFE